MTTEALTVARFIVRSSSPKPVSNLKIQKLLYYAQGWHLGIKGEPIFLDRIEAWIHGPVVPIVFREYRDSKWNPVADFPGPIRMDSRYEKHILGILQAYGTWSADQLEMQSHKEAPWIEARGKLDPKEPSNNEVTRESMRIFFHQLANG